MRNRHKSTANWGVDEGRIQMDPLQRKNTEPLSNKAVIDALSKVKDIDVSHVEVIVKNSSVFLRGFIKNNNMKKASERCVRSIDGVTNVKNELMIDSSNIS